MLILVLIPVFLFGLNDALAQEPDPALNVGVVPYSNQWQYDQKKSVLILSTKQISLNQVDQDLNSYRFHLSSPSARFFGLDYFSNGTENASAIPRLWWEYGLALSLEDARVGSPTLELSETSRQSQVLFAQITWGAMLALRDQDWIPFIGPRLDFMGYRHTSSLGGAEKDGGALYIEPVAGLLVPGLLGRISALADISIPFRLHDDYGFFTPHPGFELGMGLAF